MRLSSRHCIEQHSVFPLSLAFSFFNLLLFRLVSRSSSANRCKVRNKSTTKPKHYKQLSMDFGKMFARCSVNSLCMPNIHSKRQPKQQWKHIKLLLLAKSFDCRRHHRSMIALFSPGVSNREKGTNKVECFILHI